MVFLMGLSWLELMGQLLRVFSKFFAFPGNLGDSETLRAAWQLMEGREPRP